VAPLFDIERYTRDLETALLSVARPEVRGAV